MGHPLRRRRRRRHVIKLAHRHLLKSINSQTLLSTIEKIYQCLENRLVPAIQLLFEEADRKNESRTTSVADGSIPLVSVDSFRSSSWLTTTGMIAREIIEATEPTKRHPLMNLLASALKDYPARPSGRALLLRDAISSLDDPLEATKISINGKSLLGYDFNSLPVPFRIVDPTHRKVTRVQRIRGYRDKGSLAPSSTVTIRQTRKEYAELVELKTRYDKLTFIESTANATKAERQQWFQDEFGDTKRQLLENALALLHSKVSGETDQG